MNRFFKYILILLLVASCKPKQIVATHTVRDTIYVEVTKTVQVPIKEEVVISNPCDSLGVLRRFKETLEIDKVNISLESINGNIVAKINVDSLINEVRKEYIGKEKIVTKYLEVDKPVPFIPKWVYYLIGITVLLLIYLFRRFIPFLRWLP